MNEEELIIENIIKKAIANGGQLSYGKTEFSSYVYNPVYLANINFVLEKFGQLNGLSKDGTWHEFIVDERGRAFIKNGGFEGEKLRKEQDIVDLELDRASKIANIQNARTNKHTLNVAVIAGLIAVTSLLKQEIVSLFSYYFSYSSQEYATVLLSVLSLILIVLLVREYLIARKGYSKDNQSRNIP